MAGIDKTYTDSYKDYKEFKEWADSQIITFFNGRKERVGNWVWDYSEKDFENGEIPIMNTPTWLDIYLIKNCPCKFVVDRMKQVYSNGFYDLKNVDQLSNIPVGYEQNRKIIITNTKRTKISLNNKGYKGNSWWIQCINSDWGYNDEWGTWVNRSYYLPCNTNTMHTKTIKSLIRKLRKMYLPAGLEFNLSGRLIGEHYKIRIK